MQKLILHADDDPDDKHYFREILKELDPQVTVLGFNNGLELMQHLTRTMNTPLPSLVVLDVRMPIWDGIRTLQAIKSDPKHLNIPVIIWSTAELDREVKLSIRSGAEDFLIKPTVEDEWISFREKLLHYLNTYVNR